MRSLYAFARCSTVLSFQRMNFLTSIPGQRNWHLGLIKSSWQLWSVGHGLPPCDILQRIWKLACPCYENAYHRGDSNRSYGATAHYYISRPFIGEKMNGAHFWYFTYVILRNERLPRMSGCPVWAVATSSPLITINNLGTTVSSPVQMDSGLH